MTWFILRSLDCDTLLFRKQFSVLLVQYLKIYFLLDVAYTSMAPFIMTVKTSIAKSRYKFLRSSILSVRKET